MVKLVLQDGAKNRITDFTIDAQNGVYIRIGTSNTTGLSGMCIVNVMATVTVGGVNRSITALLGRFQSTDYTDVDVCTIADGNVLHHIVADCTYSISGAYEYITVTFKDVALDNGIVTSTILVPSNVGVVQYVGFRPA